MVLLEAAVHSSLRAFLREQGRFYWSHHLTMGRLVARAISSKAIAFPLILPVYSSPHPNNG